MDIETSKGGTDPNEARDMERARGKDHAKLSDEDMYGTNLNPVRETENVASGLKSGGSGG
jgi:hypothetical protein